LAETGPATWYVRPYRPGDEEQLASLYAEVFGRERAVDVWRWKLMEREGLTASVWVAATRDDERIVGQYAGIHLRLRLRGEERLGLAGTEAITAPDFRRQGILTSMGEAAHQAWAHAGYAAALGLPNEQWGSRKKVIGFKHIFPLAWLRFPLHAERVVRRISRLPTPLVEPAALAAGAGSFTWRSVFRNVMHNKTVGSNVHVEEATGPDDFDHLWSRLAGEYENVVVRDGNWVDWRFTRSAAYSYKVLLARKDGEPSGYIAYRMPEQGGPADGYIADIFVGRNDTATTAALVLSALDNLSARGAGIVLATAAPGSALHRQLRRVGFLPARRWTAFNFEIAPLQPDVDPASLSDPRTWHITAGDFDVI
jgi:hypothetical protein